jgi:membrane-bound lytic murein transglycosylase MltF
MPSMLNKILCALGVLVAVSLTFSACGGDKPAEQAAAVTSSTPTPTSTPLASAPEDEPLPPSEIESQLPPAVRDAMFKPLIGDFDELIEHRFIRVGVPFNRTFYFVDKGMQRGVAVDYGRLVEERVNAHLKTGNENRVHVVFVALPREQLLPALLQGKVDIVAAQVTVRPELEKLVAFTNPTRMNVSEIVVTGPSSPAIASIADLSGKEVFTRENSSYHASLVALNEKFKSQGKPPVSIQFAPASLEDDDLLEMVNAGLMPAIVVDDYLAAFWKKVFPKLKIHNEIACERAVRLAVAARKGSPKLIENLNTFLGNYGLGTPFGDKVERKYLVSTKYVKNATSTEERKKFEQVVEFLKKYSSQYNLDYLLMAAQGYQESRLDQSARSPVGAIGVMQVMPATGKELAVGDIEKTEANIHAGVKYMRTTQDAFFKNEPMDNLNKGLMTFASYNAGPAASDRCAGKRRSAASTRTSGSATWSRLPRSASAPRR